MTARHLTVYLHLAVILVPLLVLVACGAESESAEDAASTSVMAESERAPGPTTAMAESDRARSASTRAPASVSQQASQVEEQESDASEQTTTGFYQNAPLTDESLSRLVTQKRVIVRTVDIGIIVPNVPRAREEIALLAEGIGGWEVTSERSQRHEASISVRVPAALLSEFLKRLRDMAVEVEFENSTSQDVTADFVDNEARLKVLQGTAARLLEFHAKAVNVEETVNLEAELSRVQLEIEGIQGRLRFMAETSAYSLVNVALTTEPGRMPVDIGPDATLRFGVRNAFQATFRPPDDVNEFRYSWDFGDGSEPVVGNRTAPTTNAGERVTATVSHTYTNVDESPYIVQLDIRGIGDAGLFTGTDTLIASVSRIPSIEVFAGQDRVVDEGEEVEYSGSFTRPEGLWDFRYRWDFSDGSATVFEIPGEGETRAVANHTFPDYRPTPFTVSLTVFAQSEAGEIRGSASFSVLVNEVQGFAVAGWDVGSTFKSAVRALSAVGRVLLVILIWVGIFSPVWLALIAAFLIVPRIRRRFGRLPGAQPAVQEAPAPWAHHRPDTSPAEPVAAVPPPETEPPAEPTMAPDAEGESPGAHAEEQPTLRCSNCGAAYPATDTNGQPARFCPSCGAAAPIPENDKEPPPSV